MEIEKSQEIQWRHLEKGGFFKLLKATRREGDDKNFDLVFQCLKCLPKNQTQSCQSNASSNLRRHIEKKHPVHSSEYESLLKANRGSKRGIQGIVDNSPAKRQSTLSFEASQNELDKLIVNFVTSTCQPFNVVENEDFRKLITRGYSKKSVMCSKTLKSRIDADHGKLVERMKEIFGKVDYITMSTDGWSESHKSFLGYTVSWLKEDLSRENAILGIRRLIGHHTFDVLGKEISSILKEFGIHNQTETTTTDGAANYIKTFRMFGAKEIANEEVEDIDQEQEDDLQVPIEVADVLDQEPEPEIVLPKHFKCAAHTLALVASKDSEKSLANPSLKKVARSFLAKARQIWNDQDRSNIKADKIRDLYGSLFTVPCVTRWNSLYDSFRDLKVKVDKSNDNLGALMSFLGLMHFSNDEIIYLNEYLLVMEPLAVALDKIQGDKDVCLGYLLPTIVMIKRKLSKVQDDLKFCKPLVKSVVEGLEKRFAHLFNDKDHILASLTVPRFKTSWIESPEKKAAAVEALKEAEKNVGINTETKVVERKRSFFEDLDEEEDEENVVEQYLASPVKDLSLLKNYPSILKLYRRYNTALPASGNVERLFSMTSCVLTKKRHRLSDSNVEKQVMLKNNKHLLS